MAPSESIPPSLPPSVEEAYRRKCVQLKRRMIDVEEANAASVVRLQRMHRGVEKLRLERAFLLEQLAKRTSTEVADSEGSPSPPPTPKEKPLRTKRGHRKPSFIRDIENGAGSMTAFATSTPQHGTTFQPPPFVNNASMSPTSEAFPSASQQSTSLQPANSSFTPANKTAAPNSNDQPPRLQLFEPSPKDAFEYYWNHILADIHLDSTWKDEDPPGLEDDIRKEWRTMSDEKRSQLQSEFDNEAKSKLAEEDVDMDGGGGDEED